MNLRFLGTASGTGYPAAWCECAHCRFAREQGGRNLRARSSALLDGDVLLDMNGETIGTANRLGARLLDVEHLLVTHAHEDHFQPDWLVWRRMKPGIDSLPEDEQRQVFASRFTHLPELTVYGNRYVGEAMRAVKDIHLDQPDQSMTFRQLEAGQAYDLGADLRVTPVYAEHAGEDYTFNYIIQRGGKTLLYALDTGGYSAQSLAVLSAFRYDAIVMEGTFGPSFNRSGHMTLDKNIQMLRYFTDNGLWANEPRFYLSHLAPHWTPPHEEYVRMVAPLGMQVAYVFKQIEGLTPSEFRTQQ